MSDPLPTIEELQRLATPAVCAALRAQLIHAEEKVFYGNTMKSRWATKNLRDSMIAAGRAKDIRALADEDYHKTVKPAHEQRRDFLRALCQLLPP